MNIVSKINKNNPKNPGLKIEKEDIHSTDKISRLNKKVKNLCVALW